MRLDQFLSHTTDLSRSLAKRAIRHGAVCVDGETVKRAGFDVAEGQEVTLDGVVLEAPGARYFMLNKPAGYVCASHDGTHPTALYLLDEPHLERLHFAGRLDIDATGLLLITDDGQWSHAITSPRHDCAKRYRATLAEPLGEGAAARFAAGIELQGEERRCAPAELTIVSPTEAVVVITEGRYHQVKRMFAALGNRVVALRREAIGPLELDPALEPGDYRPLSAEEVALFP